MRVGFMGSQDGRGQHYRIPKGQYIAGHAIGIIHLEVWYPLLPGNVVNATTYPFPVRLKLVPGANQERLLGGDETLLDSVLATCKELEVEGVRAIVGACGYFGNFQREVAAAMDMPVFLSSLLQVPIIHRSLRPGQKVGIMCADSPALSRRALESCGITPEVPISLMGLEDRPEFSNILYSRGEFDYDRLEVEMVDAARRLVDEQGEIGAILLECSDMPPFAAAVQRATGLPVFDFITMIRWIQHALVQRPYEGYF